MLGSFSGGGLGFGLAFSLKDKFSKNADKIQNSLDSLDAKATKVSNSISQLKIGGAIATAGAAVSALFLSQVNKASDLEEALNKSKEIFGAYSGEVENFANNAFKIGLSRSDALDYVSDFGNLLTSGAKLNEEIAKDYSLSLTRAAADLASFNNRDIADTQRALRGAITGEFESIKSLGVKINMQELKKEVEATGKAFNNTTKTQAIYNEIMKQTIKAAGDFKRTSDGFANAKRILGAVFNNILIKLGQVALPIVKNLVKFLSSLAVKVMEFLETADGKRLLKFIFNLGLVLTAIGLSIAGFAALRLAMLTSKVTFTIFRSTVISMAKALTGMNLALLPALIVVGLFVGIIYAAVKGLTLFNNSTAHSLHQLSGFQRILAIVGGILQAVYEFWKFFDGENSGITDGTMNRLIALGISKESIEAIGSWVVRVRAILQGFGSFFSDLWNWMKKTVDSVRPKILDFLNTLGFNFEKAVSPMESFREAGRKIAAVVMTIVIIAIIALIAHMISLAIAVIAATWPILLIIGIIAAIVAVIMNWGKITEWFSGIWSTFTSFIGEKWNGMMDYFKNTSLANIFIDAGLALIKFLITPFTALLTLLSKLPGKVGKFASAGLEAVDSLLTRTKDPDGSTSIPNSRTFNSGAASDQLALSNTAIPRALGPLAANSNQPNPAIPPITLITQIDSEEVSKKVIDKQELENSRS